MLVRVVCSARCNHICHYYYILYVEKCKALDIDVIEERERAYAANAVTDGYYILSYIDPIQCNVTSIYGDCLGMFHYGYPTYVRYFLQRDSVQLLLLLLRI